MMECWNDGVLEYWDDGVLERPFCQVISHIIKLTHYSTIPLFHPDIVVSEISNKQNWTTQRDTTPCAE